MTYRGGPTLENLNRRISRLMRAHHRAIRSEGAAGLVAFAPGSRTSAIAATSRRLLARRKALLDASYVARLEQEVGR